MVCSRFAPPNPVSRDFFDWNIVEPWRASNRLNYVRGFEEGSAREIPTPPSDHIPLGGVVAFGPPQLAASPAHLSNILDCSGICGRKLLLNNFSNVSQSGDTRIRAVTTATCFSKCG
jgi:hypothetical protein